MTRALEGMAMRFVGQEAAVNRVMEVDEAGSALRLEHELPEVERETPFELFTGEEAPILAARLLTGTPVGLDLPPIQMRLATTRGTNALLERKGGAVTLFVTEGFGDLLRIGNQQRPDLFSLRIERPPPLYERVIEVPERLAADGSVLCPLDPAGVRDAATAAIDAGVTTAAVSLLHAYRNPVHERQLGEVLRAAGFRHISLSSEIAPAIHYLDRTTTTVVDAYLADIMGGYVGRVEEVLGADASEAGVSLHLMSSSGGLVRSSSFRPKDSLLSGPAAGVVGAAAAGEHAGARRVITFDMGGTSTDVARYDGDFDYAWRHRVGDAELLSPALAIETVAAGGGSICAWRSGGLAVGPESAGASPGPACYGGGGPLTLTDCNLLLGRIDPESFGIPLHREAAEEAVDRLRNQIAKAAGELPGRETLLAGLIDIADERMADAIRAISVRKGYDPAEYSLVPFGGAGAQHACGVARRLRVSRLIIPPDGGLLSALGLGRARHERIVERQLIRPIEPDCRWIREAIDDLRREGIQALATEGIPSADVHVRRRIANVRFVGQETTLPVDLGPDVEQLTRDFLLRYEAVYGHAPEARPIELESLRIIVESRGSALVSHPPTLPTARASGSLRAWMGGRWEDIPLYPRAGLQAGSPLRGPCVVRDPHTSIIIEEGWAGHVHRSGAIVLQAEGTDSFRPQPGAAKEGGESGPIPIRPDAGAEEGTVSAVREQLFTSRFEALVVEMGEQLRRTAVSTNVKERLDFSCALLNPAGELVANAPHIPVHLGALGLCVRSVAEVLDMEAGDVVVTNHPAYGGSHLPDITVITAVHSASGERAGYVASRAHHAEIGGSRPGSMPPDARTLGEEGVVIPPTLLVRGGVARWNEIGRLLTSARYPSRSPEDNLSDLRAQVAANHRGAVLLRGMVDEHGLAAVVQQMDALTTRAERGARAALTRMAGRVFEAVETLDDGSPLAVRIAVDAAGEAEIDFSGSGDVHPGNLNATPAVVRSAVLYVLRLLIDESLPLNEGLLRPVRLRLSRSLLSPDFDLPDDRAPAVVGGNTEVSQRLVDTLLKALSLAACSQGTMNNVLWGNERYGYYETIAGGAGAVEGFAGADGVHTHMTNTRITDTEVLEWRFPVRVERFGLRRGSGGTGRYPGGCGVVREITFLEPVALSLLAQHRHVRPFGMMGGGDGAVGRQWIQRASGEIVPLRPIGAIDVQPGDRLVVETPGGGGWGRG